MHKYICIGKLCIHLYHDWQFKYWDDFRFDACYAKKVQPRFLCLSIGPLTFAWKTT